MVNNIYIYDVLHYIIHILCGIILYTPAFGLHKSVRTRKCVELVQAKWYPRNLIACWPNNTQNEKERMRENKRWQPSPTHIRTVQHASIAHPYTVYFTQAHGHAQHTYVNHIKGIQILLNIIAFGIRVCVSVCVRVH